MNIERIKTVPIEAIAERLGLSVTKHKCVCPFHDDHHPSLSFRPSRNSFRCFVCEATGDGIGLVKKMRNVEFAEAVEWIADNFDLTYTLEDNRKNLNSRHIERKVLNGQKETECLPAEPLETFKTSIDISVVERSQSVENSFCKALLSAGLFTEEQMQRAAKHYHLGSTHDGGVIFWQIDENRQVHEGKVMHYQDDCRRCRDRNPVTISWLIRNGKTNNPVDISLPPAWRYVPCLFGLHQLTALSSPEEEGRIIAIVESEKTAIICSEYFPNHIWLATGGLSNLSTDMLRPLAGRKVIIFPDTDPDGATYRKWKTVAEKAEDAIGTSFPVSPVLELNATPEQKSRKIDIADYILEQS